MTQETSIEWCDLTWNPVHGCSKVSPGCAHCYAETLSRRYKHTLLPWTDANAAENVLLKPHKLSEPLSKGKDWQGLGAAAAAAGKTDGKLVFVNSTSDLFHEEVPDEFIARVFGVMHMARRHTFQILTKRPERMRDLLKSWSGWKSGLWEGEHGSTLPLPNVWLGVSIENRRYVSRADVLRETPAAMRFISAEPLLGPLVPPDGALWFERRTRPGIEGGTPTGQREEYPVEIPGLDLTDIDWVIVGGESGSGHRPMRPEWAEDLLVACGQRQQAGQQIAFMLKQMGGARPGDRLEDLPEDLRIRDFPQVTG